MEDSRGDYMFYDGEKRRIQRKKSDAFLLHRLLFLRRIIFWSNHQVVPISGWYT